MELEEAKKLAKRIVNDNYLGDIGYMRENNEYELHNEAISTILQELDRLQKENDLAKKALIANSYEADERNNLLAEVQRLKKENEKLKEIDLTTVHIKGACDEKERWRNKIREKIELIKILRQALYNESNVITILQDLLKEG